MHQKPSDSTQDAQDGQGAAARADGTLDRNLNMCDLIFLKKGEKMHLLKK